MSEIFQDCKSQESFNDFTAFRSYGVLGYERISSIILKLAKNNVMEWVKEISLELRVEYVSDSSGWFCNPDTDCFCDIRRKSWPFNNVSRDNGLSVKRYPRVSVQVSYFASRNSSKQPYFSLNCDVLQMNSMTHQCVIEQVRSSIALARELGKRIVVSQLLARAAKEFLEFDICPRSNCSCFEARHIGTGCARTALFRDVLQIHNAPIVLSLRDMARTVFLGTVGSISEACDISQLPHFIENFTFDCKTTPHGRTFACVEEECHGSCKLCDTIPLASQPSEFWPCDLIQIPWNGKELIVRLFSRIVNIGRYVEKMSGNEKQIALRYLHGDFRVSSCVTRHCSAVYLEWLSRLGLYQNLWATNDGGSYMSSTVIDSAIGAWWVTQRLIDICHSAHCLGHSALTHSQIHTYLIPSLPYTMASKTPYTSPQWDTSMEEVNALSDEALLEVISSMETGGKYQRSILKAPKRKSSTNRMDVDVLNEVRKKLFEGPKK